MPQDEKTVAIHDETPVPLRWIVIVGVGILGAGMFIGGMSSRVEANEKRITALEQALEAIPKIDRRLARMEGARGIKAPQEDRMPAANAEP